MRQLTYTQSLEYIYKRIPTQQKKKFPGTKGLKRMERLLALLDNPQEKYNVVHIAGTSGKGSCTYLTSLILASQGLKTGMSLSPHVVDVRERCQIKNQYISKEKFSQYLSEIILAIEAVDKSRWGKVTYFEAITALAYHAFYKEAVDVAIMETGMGGLLDATNVIKRNDKICIISKIGLDHTAILGKTIKEIALQKSGIIKQGNTVFTVEQEKAAHEVIEQACIKNSSSLAVITKHDYETRLVGLNDTRFNTFAFGKKREFSLGLTGAFQIENCLLSIRASEELLKKIRPRFNEASLNKVLKDARLPARFEVKSYKGKSIIFDGAHNTQKMLSFVSSLKLIRPSQKFSFLLAFKKDKEIPAMLEVIAPIASEVILTSFKIKGQDFIQISKNPKAVEALFKKLSFENTKVIENPIQAFAKISQKQNPVVTGSFYLISQIYQACF